MRANRAAIETSVIVGVSLLAAVANVMPAHAVDGLRQVLAVPMLVLPGWSVSRAVFSKESIRLPERVAISGCMTIALLVLIGLALDALPGGLTRTSWSWSLIAVTVVASAVSLLLRRTDVSSPGGDWRLGVGSWLGVLAALSLILAGFAVARRSALRNDAKTRFTQLWMLPGASKQEIQYGVKSYEGHVEHFVLTARLGDRSQRLLRRVSFSLQPGKSLVGTLHVARPARSSSVILDLYKTSSPSGSPYRSTKLIIG